jgi:hypothetical protein
MKVVINRCFGGFSLSNKAVARLAELNGKKAYFFKQRGFDGPYLALEEGDDDHGWCTAFDVSNPNDYDKKILWDKHYLTNRPDDRSDPKLVQVIEELGAGHRTGASGDCADLRIVEIPDGICWEIDEYDGNESISEVHRSWR